MAETTKIEWTDHTFNPWIGCSKVHAGCAHCYAEADMDHRRGRVKWGPNGTRSRTSEDYWKQPLKWNRQAAKDGERRRVFCASLADVFEDWQGDILDSGGRVYWIAEGEKYVTVKPDNYKVAPWRKATMDDLRRDLFALIDQTPDLDWLLLTKRPENVRRMWLQPLNGHDYGSHQQRDRANALRHFGHWPTLDKAGFRPNVWLGTSPCNQQTADEAIPELLKLRDLCPVLFLSCEPLLGPVDLRTRFDDGSSREYLTGQFRGMKCKGVDGHPDFTVQTCDDSLPKISWVIIGGESGPNARPCDVAWIRSLVEQCRAAEVPAFVKQLGSNAAERDPIGPLRAQSISMPGRGSPWRSLPLRDPKGGSPEEWPADLRVRQFPELKGVTP